MRKENSKGQFQFKTKQILNGLHKIQRDINNTIEQFEDLEVSNRPRCAKCGWSNLRVRMDKTYFCQSCGYDSKKV